MCSSRLWEITKSVTQPLLPPTRTPAPSRKRLRGRVINNVARWPGRRSIPKIFTLDIWRYSDGYPIYVIIRNGVADVGAMFSLRCRVTAY
ncbi:hypothetical protein EVAR_100945_1 [Eumeta japonica]|uniref:Uncharacterized protein n=1 Tax=Eumeta variegata TaxID=151549 RepID=A0A4C2A668_EUMVA|nr:hypothetical protein EVAR_100945_1 [Eumeta japonica]